ncbi:MAG UNVERIFIED_CONTAM: hypothetical protein LVT10_11785 [Anaerolineae bacterium]
MPHLPVDVQALDADFYGLQQPQNVRADGAWVVLNGKRELLAADAAVSGRRRHDP